MIQKTVKRTVLIRLNGNTSRSRFIVYIVFLRACPKDMYIFFVYYSNIFIIRIISTRILNMPRK